MQGRKFATTLTVRKDVKMPIFVQAVTGELSKQNCTLAKNSHGT